MNQQRWTEAADRFRKKRATQEAQEVQRAVAKTQATENAKERQGQYTTDVQNAAVQLANFMRSEEWEVAQKLLAASRRHIVIAEENEGGGMGVVYFLDSNGLQKSAEAMGVWMAYAKKDNIPEPRVSSISAEEAVRLAIRKGAEPRQIIEQIRKQLDGLADEVL